MTPVRVFQVTKCIWQGALACEERLVRLRSAGISHILNVGDSPSVLSMEDGPFLEVADYTITDLARIPNQVALECLTKLHAMVCHEGSHVYIHCSAGWNRSPTILWLYLIACGMEANVAKQLITARNWDGTPGHSQLVDDSLIETVFLFGARFRPHPRPIALESAQI